MSKFDEIKLLPEDSILSLPIIFSADKREKKVNMGIGSYKDIDGKPVVLECVRKAERIALEKQLDKEYLPIQGNSEFISAFLELAFGPVLKPIAERTLGMQTIGGTGALRVGGEFLAHNGFRKIFLPIPTWPNHISIFERAGFQVERYPYSDAAKHDLDFEKMCEAISSMPEKSVILLHTCCQNPFGIDPTAEQWQKLSSLIKKHHLIPFFDMAYQGFAQGIEEDAYPVRLFAEQGHEMFLAYSFSKNMGLYGDRAGALAVIAEDQEVKNRILSQLKQTVRGMYSMPPLYPGRIVPIVLNSELLRNLWRSELEDMRRNVNEARHALVSKLKSLGVELNYLEKQRGLFCYFGLTPEQVLRLREDYGVYMVNSGRANIAGLTEEKIDIVAAALKAVL